MTACSTLERRLPLEGGRPRSATKDLIDSFVQTPAFTNHYPRASALGVNIHPFPPLAPSVHTFGPKVLKALYGRAA
jgi:hypothetical protein